MSGSFRKSRSFLIFPWFFDASVDADWIAVTGITVGRQISRALKGHSSKQCHSMRSFRRFGSFQDSSTTRTTGDCSLSKLGCLPYFISQKVPYRIDSCHSKYLLSTMSRSVIAIVPFDGTNEAKDRRLRVLSSYECVCNSIGLEKPASDPNASECATARYFDSRFLPASHDVVDPVFVCIRWRGMCGVLTNCFLSI